MEKMNENETKDMAVQVRDYQTELEQIMRSNVSPRVLKDRISDNMKNGLYSNSPAQQDGSLPRMQLSA